ncbi:Rab1a [Hexamita inflata]|uniref:Rab1a n=1 Tax=Hexamita inflata TaxID=28002 RepID=A0AA86V2S5_9EUKA|nr:Rab1a [Hexamita inflata]CAI9973947.1 Rab1a [Hexamita inflata]
MPIKVVLLGASSAGKTSLAIRLTRKTFSESTASTIGMAFQKASMIIDNKNVNFEIWDTAGQEKYSSLTPIYYRQAQVIIVVYDVQEQSSYEKAQFWINEVQQSEENKIIILCANKCDVDYKHWAVSSETSEQYALTKGLKLYKTSAKTGLNVEQIFTDIARQVGDGTPIEQEDPLDITVVDNKKGCC